MACSLNITHFSNNVVCLNATSLAVILYGFGPLTYKQLILTSAGVREAEALCTLSAVPYQSSLVLSPQGAASTGPHLEKVILVGGNKQSTTKLCFIWEDHVGGFQELQKQWWSKYSPKLNEVPCLLFPLL